MYVTIIVDIDDAAAYGPHADTEPAAIHTAPDARHIIIRLCHPTLLDRATRVIGEHKTVAQLDAETARVLTEIARQRRPATPAGR